MAFVRHIDTLRCFPLSARGFTKTKRWEAEVGVLAGIVTLAALLFVVSPVFTVGLV